MKDQIFDVENTVIENGEKKLSFFEKLKDNVLFRKGLIILGLAIIWQLVALYVNNPLMLPTFTETSTALYDSLISTNPETGLLFYLGATIQALFIGFIIGVAIAIVTTIIAINSRIGQDILHTVTSLVTPLPAIALGPISLIFFGLSYKSIIFITSWAVLWPVALTLFMAFKTSPPTILNVGRNIGLKGFAYTMKIRIPDCLPEIYVGLRTGFSNGFRALISYEMIIGAAASKGGLGWFIMTNKNSLDVPTVFAGIIATMVIGLLFEVLFTYIEKHTIKKYGMSVDVE